MEFVREYLNYQKVPDDLQVRIKSYYKHCWKNLKSFPFSEMAILEDLSPALRRDVVLHLNSLGDASTRPAYLEALKAHFAPLVEVAGSWRSKRRYTGLVPDSPRPGA